MAGSITLRDHARHLRELPPERRLPALDAFLTDSVQGATNPVELVRALDYNARLCTELRVQSDAKGERSIWAGGRAGS